MHPGGTNIIKSNAGVDCSNSFDVLAHTNNPEVSSLLTKYYIGEMTPKPTFHHSEELSMLYDLWASYLRVTVETIVASHFEMGEIMESSILWFQGELFNMGGVRRFYHYQSRLLQAGFSTLFGVSIQISHDMDNALIFARQNYKSFISRSHSRLQMHHLRLVQLSYPMSLGSLLVPRAPVMLSPRQMRSRRSVILSAIAMLPATMRKVSSPMLRSR